MLQKLKSKSSRIENNWEMVLKAFIFILTLA